MAFLVGKIVLDTDCKVVLSSSWRHHPDGIKVISQCVTPVMDKTPDAETRGEEIQMWLDEHPEVTQYAILDDDADILPEQKENFFKTTWAFGLTEDIAKAVTEHLNLVP